MIDREISGGKLRLIAIDQSHKSHITHLSYIPQCTNLEQKCEHFCSIVVYRRSDRGPVPDSKVHVANMGPVGPR